MILKKFPKLSTNEFGTIKLNSVLLKIKPFNQTIIKTKVDFSFKCKVRKRRRKRFILFYPHLANSNTAVPNLLTA